MEHPVLAPLAPPASDAVEHAVVLLGHGLKRAYLVADRLVWRMTADPCPNEWGTPGSGLRDTVRTEDGEVFWVADPARLLADVELPELETRTPEPRVLTAAEVEPLPAPLPVATIHAPEAPAVASVVPAEAAPAVAAPTKRRALIADDSLTTRLLLARLLERQGFEVETVSTSAELIVRLAAEWTVLFTDLELPDRGGPEWLREVRRIAAASASPVHVVALVRDGGDLDVARAAGIEDSLLKPFARESLASLLARHGWSPA